MLSQKLVCLFGSVYPISFTYYVTIQNTKDRPDLSIKFQTLTYQEISSTNYS